MGLVQLGGEALHALSRLHFHLGVMQGRGGELPLLDTVVRPVVQVEPFLGTWISQAQVKATSGNGWLTMVTVPFDQAWEIQSITVSQDTGTYDFQGVGVATDGGGNHYLEPWTAAATPRAVDLSTGGEPLILFPGTDLKVNIANHAAGGNARLTWYYKRIRLHPKDLNV